MTGLEWQSWTLHLVTGQNQKDDPRALESPELAMAIDVQFDSIGGLQTRYPFADFGTDIFGGGDLSNMRRIVENGSELLVFTKDSLYSWNAANEEWVRKGTHLAVKVDEQPRFVSTGDQVDCDRAELAGTIVYAWTDRAGLVYVAAIDKETGSVLMAPTSMTGGSRPRLVALATKILLFIPDQAGKTELRVWAIDPADPATGVAAASTAVSTANYQSYYDVVKVPGLDQVVGAIRRAATSFYEVFTVTGALVVAKSAKARTVDGPIAVSADPTGLKVQIARASGANVEGDLITISTLVDVFIAQALGNDTLGGIFDQITCAHRSVQNGGEYRCYVFWSANENDDPSAWVSKSNWVDTGGTIGTQANFVRRLGVASRAFDRDGSIYVWGAFAQSSGSGYRSFRASLQNTYFLYRDDAFLVAKAAAGRAGGFAYSTGCLPGVALTDTATYSWCGTDRRVIELGPKATGYADRGPRDITITFDSNEARRCARLGKTLYITGGEILQYDGCQLVEVGFHIFPWNFTPTTSGAGNIEDGTYAYQVTERWDNAVGEIDRSTTATTATIESSAGPNKIGAGAFPSLHITHKSTPSVAVEMWRTLKNPSDDSPFYLVTSKDPANSTNPNRFIANDPTSDLVVSFEDDLADEDLSSKESHPENGGVLENLSPPAASIILASDTRLFLGGVAGDPDRVWYSKQRGDGEVASFHDALVVNIPADGGRITAIWEHNETVIVAREHALYALLGSGFGNSGSADGSQNFVARRIPGNVGVVSQEAVAAIEGGSVFKSSKGWQLLDNGMNVRYVGAAFSDYDDEEVLSMQVAESQHQVRVLTEGRMLVFDTLGDPWRCAEWTIDDGLHACMWQGDHFYLSSTGPKQQLTTYTGVDYGADVETAWIKLSDLVGFGRVRWFQLLGEFRSSCGIRIRLARDGWKDGVDTYFQDKTHTPSLSAGVPLQVRHTPTIQQVQSLKVRITISPTAAGESVQLTGIGFELGMKRGLNRQLPAAQKQ